MTTDPRTGITLLSTQQRYKEQLINEGFAHLGAIATGAVVNLSLTSPPPNPSLGEVYFVKPTSSGAWAGFDNKLALRIESGWTFFSIPLNHRIYSQNPEGLYRWDGANWLAVSALGDMTKAVYDADSDGIVDNSIALNGQGASYYLSRANHTGSQPLSTLSQSSATTNQVPQWNGEAWVPVTFSGGGSAIAVSDEGIELTTSTNSFNFTGSAITVTNSGSAITVAVGGREPLTANRTYYVSTAGSDTNNGLTSGTAFRNIQKAVDVVAALDMSIYNVIIQIANGTYTEKVTLKQCLGSGSVTIQGNLSDPAAVNVVNPNPSAFDSGAFYVGSMITTRYNLYFLTISGGSQTVSPSYGINLIAPCSIGISRVTVGQSQGSCILAASQAYLEIYGDIGFYSTGGRIGSGISVYDEAFVRTAAGASYGWSGTGNLTEMVTAQRGGSVLLVNVATFTGSPITAYNVATHGRIVRAGTSSPGGNNIVDTATYGILA